MKQSKYSEPQILAILRQAEGGLPAAQLYREHGMSTASTPRDGRDGGDEAGCQHCAGLPDIWGERHMLSLEPQDGR
jgi:putative transposase